MGVEKLMRAFAQRLAQEFLVEFLYVRILMALADGLSGIFGINCLGPGLDDVHVAVMVGLAASVYAAAGAGHDFHDPGPGR